MAEDISGYLSKAELETTYKKFSNICSGDRTLSLRLLKMTEDINGYLSEAELENHLWEVFQYMVGLFKKKIFHEVIMGLEYASV